MTDNVAQHNVEKIILSKIEELKKNYKVNQYKLFILYLILMDTDEENIFKYADDLIENMELGILKYSTILKLNYYFSFNANNNRRLTEFLKEKIKYAQLKLDNKTNLDKLQGSLDKSKNSFIIKNKFKN